MDEHAKRTFETIADQCTGCGICAEGCEHLQNCGDHLPDEIAKILSAGDPDETVIDFIQKCSLCGMCCELCPEDLDIAGMVQTARSEFIESGIVDPEQYHFLWVDHDWNAFSLYRRTYNMDALYADLTQNRCNVLFFPGCMLTNEGPHLVQAAAQCWARADKRSARRFSAAAPPFTRWAWRRGPKIILKGCGEVSRTGVSAGL
ncbi:4Fe-4S dicluster domain-containing protein [Desulfosarcina cetonica]|uniref:4Fe-4S dicluster domain-containing protein n=1 Tax=Desulfosarcina cetonica TaxID=90730 RepID=UPI0006D1F8CA|nr:4Fe-4S dicluster domain-containing protein [Desulfosarcina cetonica]